MRAGPGWAGLGLGASVLLVILYLSRQVRRQAAELAGRIALQSEGSPIKFKDILILAK